MKMPRLNQFKLPKLVSNKSAIPKVIPNTIKNISNAPGLSRAKSMLANVNKNKPLKNAVVDYSNLTGVPGVSQLRLLKRKQLLPLTGNLLAGNVGEALGSSLSRGLKTSNKVRGGLKRKALGFSRGFRTGLRRNWSTLGDAVTSNAFTGGRLAKTLLENSRYASTPAGRTLLRPVSSFVPESLSLRNPLTRRRLRQTTRRLSAGAFQSFPYYAEFSTRLSREKRRPGYIAKWDGEQVYYIPDRSYGLRQREIRGKELRKRAGVLDSMQQGLDTNSPQYISNNQELGRVKKELSGIEIGKEYRDSRAAYRRDIQREDSKKYRRVGEINNQSLYIPPRPSGYLTRGNREYKWNTQNITGDSAWGSASVLPSLKRIRENSLRKRAEKTRKVQERLKQARAMGIVAPSIAEQRLKNRAMRVQTQVPTPNIPPVPTPNIPRVPTPNIPRVPKALTPNPTNTSIDVDYKVVPNNPPNPKNKVINVTDNAPKPVLATVPKPPKPPKPSKFNFKKIAGIGLGGTALAAGAYGVYNWYKNRNNNR